jgi:hypothetical protein
MNLSAIPANMTHYASNCLQTVNRNKATIAKVTAVVCLVAMGAMLAYNHASKAGLKQGLTDFEATYLENVRHGQTEVRSWQKNFLDFFPHFSTKPADFDCKDGTIFNNSIGLDFSGTSSYFTGCPTCYSTTSTPTIHEKLEDIYGRATGCDRMQFSSFQFYSEAYRDVRGENLGERNARSRWYTAFVVCKNSIPQEVINYVGNAFSNLVPKFGAK